VVTMYNYAANKDALYELVTRLCAAPGSSTTAGRRGPGTSASGNWKGTLVVPWASIPASTSSAWECFTRGGPVDRRCHVDPWDCRV
jgi:hypothetical protein